MASLLSRNQQQQEKEQQQRRRDKYLTTEQKNNNNNNEITEIYNRLTHYIKTMCTDNNNSFNTKLEFAIHAEFRSLLNKYNGLKHDYKRCIDMLKELKLHNVATQTDLINQRKQIELKNDDLQIELKGKKQILEAYAIDMEKKTTLISQQQIEINEMKMKEDQYKLHIEELNNKLRKENMVNVETNNDLKRRLNKEIDTLRDELTSVKTENNKLQKLIDNDDVNVIMERSLRRRVQKSEESLEASKKVNKELNLQWETIINKRVEEIHHENGMKISKYQEIIKKLQNELRVLRGMFV